MPTDIPPDVYRDRSIAARLGVSEGRVEDRMAGASLCIAVFQSAYAVLYARVRPGEIPPEYHFAAKATLDLYDAVRHALDEGTVDHMKPFEREIYDAIVDTIGAAFEQENKERSNLQACPSGQGHDWQIGMSPMRCAYCGVTL
jgi:hypothetical protein